MKFSYKKMRPTQDYRIYGRGKKKKTLDFQSQAQSLSHTPTPSINPAKAHVSSPWSRDLHSQALDAKLNFLAFLTTQGQVRGSFLPLRWLHSSSLPPCTS